MKVIIWDCTGQAENFLSQETIWKRLEIVYTFQGDSNLNYFPAIIHNVPYECLLIFENGQRSAIEDFMSKAAVDPEKTIFALDINSWIEHFDFASYILNKNSKFYMMVNFKYEQRKYPIFMCHIPELGGGGTLCKFFKR